MENQGKLGFGLMRLPHKLVGIDVELWDFAQEQKVKGGNLANPPAAVKKLFQRYAKAVENHGRASLYSLPSMRGGLSAAYPDHGAAGAGRKTAGMTA